MTFTGNVDQNFDAVQVTASNVQEIVVERRVVDLENVVVLELLCDPDFFEDRCLLR